jgi:pyocin large subunit-like protein
MGKTLSYAAVAALLAGASIALIGCDGGSATAARDHTAAAAASDTTTVAGDNNAHSVLNSSEGSDRGDARREPVALVDGKPMWAANRQHTAEENANYQFQRDGADFGAADVNDFVAKAHAFTTSPPKDALSLKRKNGDTLLYDAKRNIFAVVTKEGAPRTMFKPQAGKAYWDEQVARQADGGDQSDRNGGRGYHRSGGERDSSDDQG